MKRSLLMIGLSVLLITACASTEYMSPNDLNLSSAYFRTLEEPSLYEISQKETRAEHYRLTVISGITPIHSIRLKTKENGSATAIVKVAHKGTRLQGKNSLKSRKSRKVSFQDINKLKRSFETLDFQNIYSDQTVNEDEVWTHPTFLCYESVRQGQHHIVCDSTGNITKITHTLLPQFYHLGGVGEKANWSLYNWFRLDELE